MPVSRPQLYLRLHEAIRDKRSLLLVTHEHADGDAYGSLLAFAGLLGRPATMLAPDSNPVNHSYLTGVQQILTDASQVEVAAFDAVIIFDCGDVQRTHLAEQLYRLDKHRPFTAVIDHHPTTTTFLDRDLVDLKIIERAVTSTCELIYEYVNANRLAITPEIATALLAGIITDTGGFSNLATTVGGMEAAAELMRKGGNLRRIIVAAFRSKSVGILQLWGRALSRLEFDPATDIVSTAITLKDFEECGVERDASEGISNFLNSLGEGKAVLVLREEPQGVVKGSYRTHQSDIDVAALAAVYGGGGHRKAAGFTVAGKIVNSGHGWVVEPAAV